MTPAPQPRHPLVFPALDAPLEAPAEFLRACEELGIAFDEGDVERLGAYLSLLLRANAVVNLTAITDATDAWTKHIFDALTLLPFLQELPEGARVADVGSGGGLPGIPLAICLPSLRFALVEATGKKAAFLAHAAAALGMENLEVVNDRAETIGRMGTAHRERYDAVVARAVGRMAMLAELTTPLVRAPAGEGDEGGVVLLVKGGRAEDELIEAKRALHLLHAMHAGTVHTPTGRVVVLRKARRTPKVYPRRAGEPKRSPLR